MVIRIFLKNPFHFFGVSLKSYGIAAKHPDQFISDLIKIDKPLCLTLNDQVLSLKNPPKSKEVVLNTLIKGGLNSSVNNLK